MTEHRWVAAWLPILQLAVFATPLKAGQFVGIPDHEFASHYRAQRASEWCWASCVEMALSYEGIDLPQGICTFGYQTARHIGVEISVNTSFNVAGPIAQTPQQAIDTLRRSKGLDAVILIADDGTAFAAWHGGARDSGRFAGWLRAWQAAHA